MMISSAPKVRSASSIACSGFGVADLPGGVDPERVESAEAGVEALLRGAARVVLVGGPVAAAASSARECTTRTSALTPRLRSSIMLPERLAADRLVGDDEDATLARLRVRSGAFAAEPRSDSRQRPPEHDGRR